YSDETYTTKLNNIVIGSKPITVYAYYTHGANTIYFDANGGTVALTEISVPHGQTSNYLPTPVKENYVFVGWYEGDQLVDLTTPILKDTYVVAKWEGRPIVVTVDEDNGNDLWIYMAKYGEPLGDLGTPTKFGHQFVGWFNNGVEYTSETVIYQNISLKAKYEKDVHEVTLHLNNGSSSVIVNVVHDERLRNLPTFTKEGHVFVGWYYDSELSQAYDIDTQVTESFELYAKWERQEFTIKFNPNGGEFEIEEEY